MEFCPATLRFIGDTEVQLRDRTMFRKYVLSSLSALAFLAFGPLVSSANAALVEVTWTGTFSDGFDNLGLFSAAGTSLAGVEYTAVYRFDTTISHSNDGFTNQAGVGGTFNGEATPALSASLTANATTIVVNFGRYDVYTHVNIPAASSLIATEVQADVSGGGVDILFNRVSRLDDLFPLSLESVFSRAFDGSDAVDGLFQRFSADGSVFMQAHLHPTSISIAPVIDANPVPLPAAWPLMLSGVGLIGFAASRRKRRKAE